jgi:hypothetical protein
VAENDPAFGLHLYSDDSTPPASGIELRFISAAPSLSAVDFGDGTLAASNFAPLFTNVAFSKTGGKSGGDGGTDDNGYLALGAETAQAMSAHATNGTTDTVASSSVNVSGGSIATVFLIGDKTSDPTHPAQLLLCDDNVAPKGILSSCNILSP